MRNQRSAGWVVAGGREHAETLPQPQPPARERPDAGARPGTVPKHAVGRPGRRARVRAAGNRPHPRSVGTQQPEDLTRKPEPCRLTRTGRVVHTAWRSRVPKRDDLAGDIHRPGRLTMLIVHNVDALAGAFQADHPAHEVWPMRAV